VVSLLALSVPAPTRVISDTGDNVDTFIRNSNGGIWDASGANIQLAIDDLGTEGGTVWIPDGNYDFSSQIQIKNNSVRLLGEGQYITFTKTTSIPGGLLLINGSGINDMKGNHLIENIEFCNTGYTSAISGAFINCTYISGINIKNCRFRFNDDEAIIMRTVWNSDISECYIQQCGNVTNGNSSLYYVSAGSGDCEIPWIRNNLFEGGGDCCINNTDANANHAQIVDNWFEYENAVPTRAYIYWKGHYATIKGNDIIGNSLTPDVIGILTHGTRSTVSDNEVTYCEVGIEGSWASIIDSNTMAYCDNGIKTNGGCVVSNNMLQSCGVSVGDIGIDIYGGCTVTGNHINTGLENFTQIRVLATYEGAIISGNRLSGYSKVDYGIHIINSNCHNNSIIGNFFDGIYDVSAITDSGSNTTIKDNWGYDYSSYQYIPCAASDPYSSPSDGAMYLVTGNQSLAVYYNGVWNYYEKS